MLTFDEASHTYFWAGKPVPNVTRVIAHLTDYSKIDPDRSAHRPGRRQGRAQDGGARLQRRARRRRAPYRRPAGMDAPRYEAWQRFVDETGFDCIVAEEKMFDSSSASPARRI
jgi:hypothetical protein